MGRVFQTPERWHIDVKQALHHNVVIIMLGEFEYLLISAAMQLGDQAYGAAVRVQMETMTGRKCSIGALYTTLDRMESKGLVETWMGDPTPQRGGRAKRMIRVTPKGMRAGGDFYSAITRASRGLQWAAAPQTGELG